MTKVSANADERQIGDVKSDEKDQHGALHGEAEHVARLREHRGIAGDRGDDARAADPFQFQKLRMPDHDPSAARGVCG